MTRGILAIACLVSLAAAAGAAPGNTGKPQTTDIASSGLVGRWLVLGLDGTAYIEFRAEGSGEIRQGDEAYPFSYTVNASVSPHWLDLVSEGDTTRTIYELLDGQTLLIADDVADERPRDFGADPLLLSRALGIPVEEAPVETFLGNYHAMGDSRYSAIELRAGGGGLVFGTGYPEGGLPVAWRREGAHMEVTIGDARIRFGIVDGMTLKGPSDGTANSGWTFYRKDPAGRP